jgi:hypothetical protein
MTVTVTAPCVRRGRRGRGSATPWLAGCVLAALRRGRAHWCCDRGQLYPPTTPASQPPASPLSQLLWHVRRREGSPRYGC